MRWGLGGARSCVQGGGRCWGPAYSRRKREEGEVATAPSPY